MGHYNIYDYDSHNWFGNERPLLTGHRMSTNGQHRDLYGPIHSIPFRKFVAARNQYCCLRSA